MILYWLLTPSKNSRVKNIRQPTLSDILSGFWQILKISISQSVLIALKSSLQQSSNTISHVEPAHSVFPIPNAQNTK